MPGGLFEFRTGGPGTQDRYGDSGALYLVGDGVRKRDHESLAGVIHRHKGTGHKGGGGADIQDAARTAPQHIPGRNSLSQVGRRRHIDLRSGATSAAQSVSA